MSDKKSWIEIVLMPIVIAIVGIMGTLLITNQQNNSAEIRRTTELTKSQESATADRQIKVLELFADRILSPDQDQRVLALRLLTAIDGELAKKLADAVAENDGEQPEIKALASQVSKQVAARGYSFAVIASYQSFEDAVNFAKTTKSNESSYPIDIYLSENGYYGVTLGGYLSNQEAVKRVNYAKKTELSADAYVRTSHNWNDNLFVE